MSIPQEKVSYHTQATGAAAATVAAHEQPATTTGLELFGSCFCPFVQRVWIALEVKQIAYRWIELDPYHKTADFLALNPRGLVPALRHVDVNATVNQEDGGGGKSNGTGNSNNSDAWTCYESSVLLEYLEEAFADSAPSLLTPLSPPSLNSNSRSNPKSESSSTKHAIGVESKPNGNISQKTRGLTPSASTSQRTPAQQRAHERLWTDHVNRKVIPSFYHVLRAQMPDEQAKEAATLRTALAELTDAGDVQGPFWSGTSIGWVDVQAAPWLLRLRRVLTPYRGWPSPSSSSSSSSSPSRFDRWLAALEAHPAVQATTSDDQLYLDSYQRYAENRPGTSQVADAVNSGRGLP